MKTKIWFDETTQLRAHSTPHPGVPARREKIVLFGLAVAFLLGTANLTDLQAQQPKPKAVSSQQSAKVLVDERPRTAKGSGDTSFVKRVVLFPVRMGKSLAGIFVSRESKKSAARSTLTNAPSEVTVRLSGDQRCQYWQSKVDETISSPFRQRLDHNNTQNILEGIGCLLQMEGNKHRARFSGATQGYVSQLFEPATADVAALYYISYLYTQNWEHADAIALRGADGAISAPHDILKAYMSYRSWFELIKQVGLVKARELDLQPLKDIDVRWY